MSARQDLIEFVIEKYLDQTDGDDIDTAVLAENILIALDREDAVHPGEDRHA